MFEIDYFNIIIIIIRLRYSVLTTEKNEKDKELGYLNESLKNLLKEYQEEQKKTTNLESQLIENTRSLNNLIAFKSSITNLTNSIPNLQTEVNINETNSSTTNTIIKEKKDKVNRKRKKSVEREDEDEEDKVITKKNKTQPKNGSSKNEKTKINLEKDNDSTKTQEKQIDFSNIDLGKHHHCITTTLCHCITLFSNVFFFM